MGGTPSSGAGKVTVVFADVHSFGRLVQTVEPSALVEFLHALFQNFDTLCHKSRTSACENGTELCVKAESSPCYVVGSAPRNTAINTHSRACTLEPQKVEPAPPRS